MSDDVTEVSQLILRERQGRDRSWWDQMLACYAVDSHVRVSWFQGTGHEFVERSRAMVANGTPSVHRMSPPVVRVVGDRAIAEVPTGIEVRTGANGVEADLVSYTRLLVRAERSDDGWKIRRLEGIYERDELRPAVPGTALVIDPAELAPFRPAYRCLAWLLGQLGYPVDPDLPGDDRPDEVAQLYDAAMVWLHEAERTVTA